MDASVCFNDILDTIKEHYMRQRTPMPSSEVLKQQALFLIEYEQYYYDDDSDYDIIDTSNTNYDDCFDMYLMYDDLDVYDYDD